MRSFVMLSTFLLLAECSSPSSADQPDLRIGEYYTSARQRLISAGWRAIQAECSPSNMCFGDMYPEMATNMETGAVCPTFIRGSSRLVVCLNVIPDDAIVASFRVEH